MKKKVEKIKKFLRKKIPYSNELKILCHIYEKKH